MALSNPKLAQLITDAIGESWIKNLDELRKLEPLGRRRRVFALRGAISNRQQTPVCRAGAGQDRRHDRPRIDVRVQVKRIHEYSAST